MTTTSEALVPRKHSIAISLCLFFCCSVLLADDNERATVSSGVSNQRIGGDIKYLASDELKGRQPGTPEMKLAEDYIAQAFQEAGLKPGGADDSYLQPFDVTNRRSSHQINADTTYLRLTTPDGESLDLEVEQQFVPMVYRESYALQDLPVAFVGYGINAGREHNYNEYRDFDVEGKVVILIRGEPQQTEVQSVFDGENTSRYSYLQTKVDAAIEGKAAAIIMVNDADRAFDDDGEDKLASASQFGRVTNLIPFVHLKRATFNQMLQQTPVFTAVGEPLRTLDEIESAIDATLEPLSQTLPDWRIKMAGEFTEVKMVTSNILGIVQGQGALSEETIIIGAHYDHLGMGDYGSRSRDAGEAIHNGADDNATGTAAVMELARRFAKRDETSARRIVFVCFSAEELGLVGSRYYVENPVVPIEQTVAMVNFDMIGYLREDSLLMFGWDTAKDFDQLLIDANADVGLTLVKPPGGFGGSDHLAFNAAKIPNVFFNTGLNGVYHTPDDDFEAINVAGVSRVIDFSERFVQKLRTLEQKPEYQGAQSVGRKKGVKLGIAISTDSLSGRLKIEEVFKDSIADNAGVKVGDQIMAFNGKTKVNSHRRLSREIKRGTGKVVQIILDRDGAAVVLELDLKTP